jgi:outer membrane protein assembly factor BamD (BamD/ComL family)
VTFAPAPVVPAITPPTAAAPPTTPETTAAGLFERANIARRTGDTNGALAGYDALERKFPGSREARIAKATTARLLLDRGDAAGALSRFDAYLASGSPELREEAMAGRATALERLGRGEDEARAWEALLASFPGTPYAAHAKARVGRSLAQ